MPDPPVLQNLAEELESRGEFIEALSHDERLIIALAALTEFGTSEHLAAVNRFRSELARRLKEVEPILTQDPNGEARHSFWP